MKWTQQKGGLNTEDTSSTLQSSQYGSGHNIQVTVLEQKEECETISLTKCKKLLPKQLINVKKSLTLDLWLT